MLFSLIKRTTKSIPVRSRCLSTTPVRQRNPQDGADSTQPSTGSTVHRAYENESELGRKPAGYESAEHGMGEGQPYAPLGGQDRRYGGMETYEKDKGSETSKQDEGPAGTNAGGRR